jgi:hypothetical protein
MNETNQDNKAKYSDVINNEFPKLLPMFDQRLDLAGRGFKLIHSGVFPQYLPYIVYESEQCKVRFRWNQDRPYESPNIIVEYGRLHAPVDQVSMLWNGEECRCWHLIPKLVNFLDGLSPLDTENSEYDKPRVIQEFLERNQREASYPAQEHHVRLNAHIWEKYGQRLFDLLDLHRPDIWDQYRNFLKEYYTHRYELNIQQGRQPTPIRIPHYQVC